MSGDRPFGHQFAMAFHGGGEDRVRQLATATGTDDLASSFLRVHGTDADETKLPAFLHSMFCSMSLPVREPKDPFAPIFRQDGDHALAITPRPRMRLEDGKFVMRNMGVPFGAYPRLIMIYIMSQAVRGKSKEIYFGRNFTDWMRRLGFNHMSYGKNGTVTRLRDQLERTLGCEYQSRWSGEIETGSAFAEIDLRVADEFAGLTDRNGDFHLGLRITDVVHRHVMEHMVPLNEQAISELRGNATALDLYSYLAHRLPRIKEGTVVRLTWAQFATHMGNDANDKNFKRRIREVLQTVLAVYPNANVDFSDGLIILRRSLGPTERKLFGPHLHVVAPAGGSALQELPGKLGSNSSRSGVPGAAREPVVEERKALPAASRSNNGVRDELLPFPSGTLSYGEREAAFRRVGLDFGQPWDVDLMADEFRKWGEIQKRPLRKEEEWLRIWKSFVTRYAAKRNFGGDQPD